MVKKLNILGTEYSMYLRKYKDDSKFLTGAMCGYCDMMLKEIVVCEMTTFPGYETESTEFTTAVQKEVLRHEIVHAFLGESGLNNSSFDTEGGWATNEEMVDWMALQIPKMYQTFKEADAL